MAEVSAVSAYFTSGGYSDQEVVHFSYKLGRSIDSKGRPSSVVQGGVVEIEVISSPQDGPLADWMANSYKGQDGTIRVVDQEKSTLKEIHLTNGRAIGWAERFDKTPRSERPERPAGTFTLTISAEKITFSGAEHDNNWGDKA